MAQEAGTIYAEIRVALEKLQGDINQAEAEFRRIPKATEDSGKKVNTGFARMTADVKGKFAEMGKTGVGQFTMMLQGVSKAIKAAPIVGAILMIVGMVKKLGTGIQQWLRTGTEAYQAHQIEIQKMTAVLNSTGAAAWTSTRQLAANALRLAEDSIFAQNEIMKMQSVLLGFRSITGDVFDEATQAIIDMAAVLGKDLSQAAAVVGRALEDPKDGMRQLNRMGVVFGDTQRRMIQGFIDTGDNAAAQNVIMEEMARSFSGAAAAMGSVTAIQDEHQRQLERHQRAVGEATSGWTHFWTSFRASYRRGRADVWEFRNSLEGAIRRQREGWTHNDEELNRMRETLRDVSDDWDRITLEDRVINLELETNLQQAIDQSVLLEQNLRVLQQADRSMSQAVIDGARERLTAQEAVIEGIKAEISEHTAAAGARAQQIAQEMNDMDAVIEMEERLNEIQTQRQITMREIERAGMAALAAGREEALVREEMSQRIMAAYSQQGNALNSLITQVEDMGELSGRAVQRQLDLLTNLNGQLEITAENYQNLFDQIRAGGDRTITGAEFLEQIKTIERVRDFAVEAADDMLARMEANATELNLTEEEFEQRREQLIHRRVQAEQSAANQIHSLWEQTTAEGRILIQNNVVAWNHTRDAIERAAASLTIYNEEQERLRQAERDRAAREAAIEQAHQTRMENERELRLAQARRANDLTAIRDIEREIAEANLMRSDMWKNLLAGLEAGSAEYTAMVALQQQLIAGMNAMAQAQAAVDMEAMTRSYERRIREINASTRRALEMQREAALETARAWEHITGYDELVDAINSYYDMLGRRDAWEQLTRNAAWAVGQINQLFIALSQIQMSRMRRETENQRNELNERHANLMDALDAELQALLHAAGLASANTREQHAADIAEAQRSGNHRLIWEAMQAQKRWEIEDEINARKKEAERGLAMERARLDYEYARAQWGIQRTTAKLNVAQAILTALASAPWPWNLVPMGFAAGIGAAQVAAVYANRPTFRPPAFESGGIVPGNSFSGDRITARVNSGEMIMNRQQQQNMFDMINRGEGPGGETHSVTVVIEMDRKQIAKQVYDVGSRGHHFLRMRAVVK